ncbi:MAG: hypothetical protein LBC41_14295 [Clostridiales bacterium]|nr:hypothetical protein [Clostridiales bacterium]
MEQDWVTAKDCGADLKTFFLEEGDRACLNFIHLQRNIGKFYCSKSAFDSAKNCKEVLLLANAQGFELHVLAVGYMNLETRFRISELQVAGIMQGHILQPGNLGRFPNAQGGR